MIEFGYATKKSNQVMLNLDHPTFLLHLQKLQLTVDNCIQCGSCAGSCASPSADKVSFREVVALLRRGLVVEAKELLQNCINCSKCQLVCPALVETRKVIYSTLQYQQP